MGDIKAIEAGRSVSQSVGWPPRQLTRPKRRPGDTAGREESGPRARVSASPPPLPTALDVGTSGFVRAIATACQGSLDSEMSTQ